MVQRTVAGVVHDTHDGASEARAIIREQAISASMLTASSAGLRWLIGDAEERPVQQERNFGCFVLAALSAAVPYSSLLYPEGLTPPIPATGMRIFLWLSAIAFATLSNPPFPRFGQVWLVRSAEPDLYVGWAIALLFMLTGGTRGDNRFGLIQGRAELATSTQISPLGPRSDPGLFIWRHPYAYHRRCCCP